MRPSCWLCVMKHISQACILDSESRLGYPDHRWLAIGHLSEASEECLDFNPDFAQELRDLRLLYMEDENFNIDFMSLIAKIRGFL